MSMEGKNKKMSMDGNLSYFLGLQIKQLDDGIFLSQSKYAKNLIKKFGLENAAVKKTPLGKSVKLSRDDVGKDVDNTLYRSMIGSLLYLTATRPDIMYIVCLCARYQSEPKESHLKAVQRIIRYVAGTCDLGLWYTKDTNTELVGYTDSDWAGDVVDRKSTTGGCFFLGSNLISWYSKKQNCISLSTAESKYIAAGSACTRLLWMNQMIEDFGLQSQILTVLCDNSSAIDISKNPVQHSRVKHIDIRYHFIRDLVERKIVNLEHIGTDNQLADICTKALDFETFSRLIRDLGDPEFFTFEEPIYKGKNPRGESAAEDVGTSVGNTGSDMVTMSKVEVLAQISRLQARKDQLTEMIDALQALLLPSGQGGESADANEDEADDVAEDIVNSNDNTSIFS
ncbi:hypothetical protein CASFOL_021533 [Castilleja foliolosa]|uniref:Gag-pol polyprotein n=1 Tax=Castilleja foliolosa TaxID=1961234 RepID=A0ABD3CZF1_9LAMI